LEVIHTFYKGKTVTLVFVNDSGIYTNYGGSEKDLEIKETVKAIISPVKNSKIWGNIAIVGASDLEVVIWEADLKPELVEQFFVFNNYDNIKVIIDELYFRVIEIRSPEDVDNEVPYWHMLLRKLITEVLA